FSVDNDLNLRCGPSPSSGIYQLYGWFSKDNELSAGVSIVGIANAVVRCREFLDYSVSDEFYDVLSRGEERQFAAQILIWVDKQRELIEIWQGDEVGHAAQPVESAIVEWTPELVRSPP